MKKLLAFPLFILLFGFQESLPQTVITNVTQGNTAENVKPADDSLIATALGIKRKPTTLSYAITSVKNVDLSKSGSDNLKESLQSKVPGLNIEIPAAGPGSSSRIRLRGQSGFGWSGNAPLIVINGLPLDQDARGVNGSNMRDLGDNLNILNMKDIESIVFLRGAGGSSIYGSRAANGAIIITTKSGEKNQGIGIEYSISYTSQNPLNYWDLQQVYGQGINGQKPATTSAAVIYGQMGWGAKMDGSLTPVFDGTLQPYSPHPDNLFDYYRMGHLLNNSVAISAGNNKGSFRASFLNSAADGIDPFNQYKKNIVNLNVNYDLTKDLKFNLSFNYSNEKYINQPEIGQQGPGAVNFFTRLSTSIPFDALKNSATNPATGTEAQTSGFQSLILSPYYAYQDAGQRFENSRDRYLGTASLRYEITDWLYAQGRFNYNHSPYQTESKVPAGIGTNLPLNISDGTYKGSYTIDDGWITEINTDFLIGGTKRFNQFKIDAGIGGNNFRLEKQYLSQTAEKFIIKDFYSFSNGTITNFNGLDLDAIVNSAYGFAELGYKSAFYLNFSGRTDWYYGHAFYPSVSANIILSELLKKPDWLTFAKLRGSWAKAGSISYLSGEISDLIFPIVSEKEIGFETSLFKNRVNIEVTAFSKVSSRQAISVSPASSSGLPDMILHVGSLENKGLEFMAEFIPVQTKDVRWITSWNSSFLQTKVLSLGKNADGSQIKDYMLINFNGTGAENLGEMHYTVNMPMNQLYTRSYQRDAKGNILVGDNGRLLATTDYVPVGSSIPKHLGGWENNLIFKKLTLGFFIDYKLGGTVLSGTNLNMTRQGFSKLSLEGRQPGQTGLVFPGVYQSTGLKNTTVVTDLASFYGDYRNLQIGDPFIYKSDFVKLRSISLSYDLTERFNSMKMFNFIKGFVVTASCRNVAILYKDIDNLDPEAMQSSGEYRQGYENAALPTTRDYRFSISAKF